MNAQILGSHPSVDHPSGFFLGLSLKGGMGILGRFWGGKCESRKGVVRTEKGGNDTFVSLCYEEQRCSLENICLPS